MFILKLFIIFANDSLVSILIGIYADYICKKSFWNWILTRAGLNVG